MSPSLQLFGINVLQVTSGTRAKWSADDLSKFQTFVIQYGKKPLPTTEIALLLQILQLDRFGTVRNIDGDQLGPIIEVKVRRKLQAVWSDLAFSTRSPPESEKTRLQTARALAVTAGEDPPTKLPAPKEVYTPEPWAKKTRPRAPYHPNKLPSSISEAKTEVVCLERALDAARRRLAELELAELAKDENKRDVVVRSEDKETKRVSIRPSKNIQGLIAEGDSDGASEVGIEEQQTPESGHDADGDVDILSFNHLASSPYVVNTSKAQNRAQQVRMRRLLSVPKLDPSPTPQDLERIRENVRFAGIQAVKYLEQRGHSSTSSINNPSSNSEAELKAKGKLPQRQQRSQRLLVDDTSESDADSHLTHRGNYLDSRCGKNKKTIA